MTQHALKCDAALPKILLIDIETAPIKGYAWRPYESDLCHIIENSYMLCFAYKWLGKGSVRTHAICDYKGYKPDTACDKPLVKELWELLDRADIVVAHNGRAFDTKFVNARMLVHRIPPPCPFKEVDTLRIARSNFRFDSNKLNNLCKQLGIGTKLPHTGMHLWVGCIEGNEDDWRVMRRYNAQDVRLLEEFYDTVKSWDRSHPILTALAPQAVTACPTCLSHNVQRRGWNIAKVKKTPRFQCADCGSWFSGWNLGR